VEWREVTLERWAVSHTHEGREMRHTKWSLESTRVTSKAACSFFATLLPAKPPPTITTFFFSVNR
jgi:hypothetical protein